MDLHIHGRNIVITNQIKQYVNTKLGQIDRHLPGISRADVEVATEPTRSERDRIVVQVTLDVGGAMLRAQQRAANARTAVNLAAQALDRQIKRYKGHVYRSERDQPEAGGDLLGPEAEGRYHAGEAEPASSEVVANGEVVRVKNTHFHVQCFTCQGKKKNSPHTYTHTNMLP